MATVTDNNNRDIVVGGSVLVDDDDSDDTNREAGSDNGAVIAQDLVDGDNAPYTSFTVYSHPIDTRYVHEFYYYLKKKLAMDHKSSRFDRQNTIYSFGWGFSILFLFFHYYY